MEIDEFIKVGRKNGERFKVGKTVKAGASLNIEILHSDTRTIRITPTEFNYMITHTWESEGDDGGIRYPVDKLDYNRPAVVFHRGDELYWLGVIENGDFVLYVLHKSKESDEIVARM